MTARVYRAEDDDARRTGERPVARGAESQELALCGHGPITHTARRGLCRSCYRKLAEAGLELPPARSRWDGHDALERWVRSLPDDVRRRIASLLEAP